MILDQEKLFDGKQMLAKNFWNYIYLHFKLKTYKMI